MQYRQFENLSSEFAGLLDLTDPALRQVVYGLERAGGKSSVFLESEDNQNVSLNVMRGVVRDCNPHRVIDGCALLFVLLRFARECARPHACREVSYLVLRPVRI